VFEKMKSFRRSQGLLQLGQKSLDPLVQPPAVAVAFEGDLDEAVHQLRQWQAGEAPEARVHRNAGEAGEGVDLVASPTESRRCLSGAVRWRDGIKPCSERGKTPAGPSGGLANAV
jgi:hypothetical protein